jgi:hypothetical protein
MLMQLAQTRAHESMGNIFEVVNSVMASGDSLTHGERLADALTQMSMVWAVVFLVAGLTCMLNGYRYYKTVTVLLAGAIGAFAGYYVGERIGAAYIVAGCLALLLGACCMPLMKYAIAALGGLAGAFVGANAWSAAARVFFEGEQARAFAENYWVGALVGLMFLGMLAFIVFKLSIVLFTSVSGSTIAVLGALALVLQVPTWHDAVVSNISAHPIVIPLMVLVPTTIGLLLQQLSPEPAAAKGGAKPKPA